MSEGAEMAGGGTSEEEILLQVQGLVSDSLAVVSYKWLSRNFSLSSNAAKRLLQKFAEQNENSDVQVVYAISGWSKTEPQSYIIQLVPKPKLDEVKGALNDTPSIHVYSVQRSLPKDPAQLYSPDFVQAEQLFNEAAENNNCLRDNRFSAVTCELVHRLPTKRKSHVATPRPPLSGGSDKAPLPSTKPGPKAPLPTTPATSVPRKNSDATSKDDRPGEKKPEKSISPKTPHTESKDNSGPGLNAAGKRKSPATATVAVSGGSNANSLASMWGRAPAKKAASSSVAAASEPAADPPRSAALAGDAEAQIQALEEEDGSEDDMVKEFTSMRRGQMPNGAGRRRRMIVDDADEDEDEDEDAERDDAEAIIGLDSPEPPKKGKPGAAAAAAATPAARDTRVKREGAVKSIVQEEKSPSPDKESPKVGVKPVKRELSSLKDIESKSKTNNAENAPEVHAQPAVESVPDADRVSSKRKKVLKTRVDERGREVTEVVWEGEEKENVEKDKAPAAKTSAPSLKQNDTKAPVAKPQAAQKPSVAPSKPAAGKASSKASAKSAKPAKGQGNIMSFFKKK